MLSKFFQSSVVKVRIFRLLKISTVSMYTVVPDIINNVPV